MEVTKLLRERAVRLLAMALNVRDFDSDYADKLVAEALELEEQAQAIEDGSRCQKSSNQESSLGTRFGAIRYAGGRKVAYPVGSREDAERELLDPRPPWSEHPSGDDRDAPALVD